MGQTAINRQSLHNQWTFIDTLGKFQIFKNQHNQLAEKHIVRADPKIDQTDYITAYHQRYLPTKPIVNAYDAEFQHKSKSMCQNASVMTVFTEYIPHRLSDVKMLNHGQGIYVLSEALAGFAQLYGRVGPFQINEDLIGFNQEGEVKVWYNPNFAENSVDNDRIILMSTVNPYDFDRKFSQNQQHDMVEDTINAVARYAKFIPQFLQQANELKKVGFSQARRILANEIGRKAYYVPDHLFLGDKNEIIKKSGIELKHKHVFNLNKPRKGQTYPYFVQGQQRAQHQTHYLQGHPSYPNYTYETQSQSSDTNEYSNQGYYKLNGQNYRVIGTREIEGNHLNEQQIIDQITRNQNYANIPYKNNQSSHAIYDNYPNYASVRSNIYANQAHYDQNPEFRGHYVKKPKYQEGHIVLNESSHHSRSLNQNDFNPTYHSQQTVQQQDNVRVFSLGDDGRLHQQHHHNQHINQPSPQFGSTVQPQHTYVESHYHPQPRIVVNEPIVAPVYSTRYTVEPPTQSVRHDVPYKNEFNLQPQSYLPESHHHQNITHRHRIFDSIPTPHQSLVREEPQLPQRAF